MPFLFEDQEGQEGQGAPSMEACRARGAVRGGLEAKERPPMPLVVEDQDPCPRRARGAALLSKSFVFRKHTLPTAHEADD